MIRVTLAGSHQFYINSKMILSIDPAMGDWSPDRAKSLIQMTQGDSYYVEETPEQVVALIQTAEK